MWVGYWMIDSQWLLNYQPETASPDLSQHQEAPADTCDISEWNWKTAQMDSLSFWTGEKHFQIKILASYLIFPKNLGRGSVWKFWFKIPGFVEKVIPNSVTSLWGTRKIKSWRGSSRVTSCVCLQRLVQSDQQLLGWEKAWRSDAAPGDRHTGCTRLCLPVQSTSRTPSSSPYSMLSEQSSPFIHARAESSKTALLLRNYGHPCFIYKKTEVQRYTQKYHLRGASVALLVGRLTLGLGQVVISRSWDRPSPSPQARSLPLSKHESF